MPAFIISNPDRPEHMRHALRGILNRVEFSSITKNEDGSVTVVADRVPSNLPGRTVIEETTIDIAAEKVEQVIQAERDAEAVRGQAE